MSLGQVLRVWPKIFRQQNSVDCTVAFGRPEQAIFPDRFATGCWPTWSLLVTFLLAFRSHPEYTAKMTNPSRKQSVTITIRPGMLSHAALEGKQIWVEWEREELVVRGILEAGSRGTRWWKASVEEGGGRPHLIPLSLLQTFSGQKTLDGCLTDRPHWHGSESPTKGQSPERVAHFGIRVETGGEISVTIECNLLEIWLWTV